ncbi:MAG: hypothetical protein PHY15_05860 [Eubacteriales bacterium]|nr:hypothetical protein [Eubacteriales bacterium]MDD4476373.1 hypothetical protein [Eubacteriales bacterium]
MFNLLKMLCEEGKYASIYTNTQDTSKFHYGKVLAVNDSEVLIYMISPNGTFDGVILEPLKAVLRIEIDGQYDAKMKKLFSSELMVAFNEKLDSLNLKRSLLQIAQKTNKIVSLELIYSGFDDVVGFIKALHDEICEIQVVDEYGFKDGQSFVKLDDITKICYASEDEERILKLYKLSN